MDGKDDLNVKIAILGSAGQLGSGIFKTFHDKKNITAVPYTRTDIDITDFQRTHERLKNDTPDMIINCAAYNRVDSAETETKQAFLVNAFAVGELAKLCNALRIPLVHFSTDYVFGQNKNRTTPYFETDAPAPINVYGESKLKGEQLVSENCEKYFIIRTSGLYGQNGRNFVHTMLSRAKTHRETKVVSDQIITPTWTRDIIDVLENIIFSNEYGIYHVTPHGETSWHGFAKRIFEKAHPSHICIPCTSQEYPLPAQRPSYSVLKSAKTAPQRTWEESLDAYLSSL